MALQAPGHEVTWEEFCIAFRAAYIPKAVMDIQRKEFLELSQGKRDIETYGREFTRLARYAPRDVTNDEDKQELFRKGLNPSLRCEMLPFKFQTFQELYNQAITLEHGRKEMESAIKQASGDSRASSSGSKKRRVFIPYSAVPKAQYAPKTSGYAPRQTTPHATSTYGGGSSYRPTGAPAGVICYNCGEPGHISKNCPQNKASQAVPPPKKMAKTNGAGRGRLTHVNAEEAQNDPSVLMGTLRLNSNSVTVLFDSGEIGRASCRERVYVLV